MTIRSQSPATVFSKCLLVGSTVLFTISFLAMMHHRHMATTMKDAQQQEHHQQMKQTVAGPDMHQLLTLAAFTGATGMWAALTQRKGGAAFFVVLLLVLESLACLHIWREATDQMHHCHEAAQRYVVEQQRFLLQDPDSGIVIAGRSSRVVGQVTDTKEEFLCNQGVQQALYVSAAMLFVVIGALLCCATLFRKAQTLEDAQSGAFVGIPIFHQKTTTSCVVDDVNEAV